MDPLAGSIIIAPKLLKQPLKWTHLPGPFKCTSIAFGNAIPYIWVRYWHTGHHCMMQHCKQCTKYKSITWPGPLTSHLSLFHKPLMGLCWPITHHALKCLQCHCRNVRNTIAHDCCSCKHSRSMSNNDIVRT